jgi:hypothetical protein
MVASRGGLKSANLCQAARARAPKGAELCLMPSSMKLEDLPAARVRMDYCNIEREPNLVGCYPRRYPGRLFGLTAPRF